MSDPPTLDLKRFDALMDSVLEANASPEQVELFNACLRQDAQARARYIAYIDLHAALADPTGPLAATYPTDLQDDRSDIMSEVVDQALALRRQHEIEEEANKKLAAQQQEDARNRRFELRRRALPEPSPTNRAIVIPQAVVWLGLAAAIGLLVAIGFIANTPGSAPTAPPTTEVVPEAPTPPQTTPRPVASIAGSFDARWGGVAAVHVGQSLYAGDVVRLESGFAELRTASGTVVTLEGPCELVAASDRRLSLRRGRLVAHATGPAERFTVSTPRGDVVDLGTVFGVEVDGERSTRVAVFDGLVEVHSDDDASGNARVPVQVREGRMAQATRGNGGAVTVVALDARTNAAFAKTLEQARSEGFEYRRMVLTSHPVAYWTFGGGEQAALTSQAAGRERLSLRGGARLSSIGDQHWLDIPASGPHPAYAELPSGYAGLAGAETYTVECWARPRTWSEAGLVSFTVERFRNAADAPVAFHITAHNPEDSPLSPRSLRFVHRNPPAEKGPGAAIDSNEYQTGQWRHIVAVKTRTQMLLYVDGKLVSTQPDATPMTAESLCVRLGFHDTNVLPVRQFEGDLDEVAFYRHALTEEQVAEHYAAGTDIFRDDEPN